MTVAIWWSFSLGKHLWTVDKKTGQVLQQSYKSCTGICLWRCISTSSKSCSLSTHGNTIHQKNTHTHVFIFSLLPGALVPELQHYNDPALIITSEPKILLGPHTNVSCWLLNGEYTMAHKSSLIACWSNNSGIKRIIVFWYFAFYVILTFVVLFAFLTAVTLGGSQSVTDKGRVGVSDTDLILQRMLHMINYTINAAKCEMDS